MEVQDMVLRNPTKREFHYNGYSEMCENLHWDNYSRLIFRDNGCYVSDENRDKARNQVANNYSDYLKILFSDTHYCYCFRAESSEEIEPIDIKIDGFRDIINLIKDSENNTKYKKLQSHTLSLGVVLFKYFSDGTKHSKTTSISIRHARLNSAEFFVDCECFGMNDGGSSYHSKWGSVSFRLSSFVSESNFKEDLEDAITTLDSDDEWVDIDNLSVDNIKFGDLENICVAPCTMNRNLLNAFSRFANDTNIKMEAGFEKDYEVLLHGYSVLYKIGVESIAEVRKFYLDCISNRIPDYNDCLFSLDAETKSFIYNYMLNNKDFEYIAYRGVK